MNILELKGITQTYKDKEGKDWNLFEGLDFAIEDRDGKGQFVAIMGESGCGKSTILRYFTGLQKPTVGEVLVNGEPKKEAIPMIFQQPSSLEWMTVLENVMLPLTLRGIKKVEAKILAENMLKIVGLEDHVNKFAKSPLLSGGQLQRVAIARSLVANPNMIVMDEPHSSLDITSRRKMQDLLLSIHGQQIVQGLDPTFLIVTHDIREACYLADTIFIMGSNPGRVKEKITVDFQRTSEIKKTKEYLDLVDYIEGVMQ